MKKLLSAADKPEWLERLTSIRDEIKLSDLSLDQLLEAKRVLADIAFGVQKGIFACGKTDSRLQSASLRPESERTSNSGIAPELRESD